MFSKPAKIIGKNWRNFGWFLTNKHLLQLVVAGSRYFFYVVKLRRTIQKNWIVHPQTSGEKWIQFRQEEPMKKEADSRIACCHKHNWEPWTTQISASTKFFISIMFNLLFWPHSPTLLLRHGYPGCKWYSKWYLGQGGGNPCNRKVRHRE